MRETKFQPGFRLSIVDAAVLLLGIFGSLWFWPRTPWLGFAIAFVVGHFFFFCNVFRVSRGLELLWTAGYLLITFFTLRFHPTEWRSMALLPLVMTALVIRSEIRKPSYHGIGWRRLNPRLTEWWKETGHP